MINVEAITQAITLNRSIPVIWNKEKKRRLRKRHKVKQLRNNSNFSWYFIINWTVLRLSELEFYKLASKLSNKIVKMSTEVFHSSHHSNNHYNWCVFIPWIFAFISWMIKTNLEIATLFLLWCSTILLLNVFKKNPNSNWNILIFFTAYQTDLIAVQIYQIYPTLILKNWSKCINCAVKYQLNRPDQLLKTASSHLLYPFPILPSLELVSR